MEKTSSEIKERIFAKVLEEIKPSELEIRQTTANVNRLMGAIKSVVPRSVEVMVVGSIARGTFLKGDSDVDIFMLFDKSMKRDKIVKLGLEYGKKVAKKEKGRFEIRYAEHPYVRLFIESIGMRADLVPALKIDDISDMETTVDRTPMHTEFVNSNLSSRQRDNVRLLKYLLKAHGIYGAEVKTEGFSGYLCELLIHHYGSLQNLLKSASRFKLPLIIEPKTKKELSESSLINKFNSNFIVIDPVDSNRNVAAGVSITSLARLVLVAREFERKPDIKLFYGKGFSKSESDSAISKLFMPSGLDIFIILCNMPKKSEDVIYPQLRRMNLQIRNHIQKNGFTVYLATQLISKEKGLMVFVAPKQILGSKLIKGPDVFIANASSSFIKKHRNAIGFTISDSTIYALENTKYKSINDVLQALPASMLKHNDVDLSKSKLIINEMPKEHSEAVYSEIIKKLSI